MDVVKRKILGKGYLPPLSCVDLGPDSTEMIEY